MITVKNLEIKLQDEKDSLYAKVEKLETLEKKNKKNEEKLSQMNCLKKRLDEVEAEKNLIIQSNTDVEEYMNSKHKALEAKNKALEVELQELSKQLADLAEENSAIVKKYEEVCAENAQLNGNSHNFSLIFQSACSNYLYLKIMVNFCFRFHRRQRKASGQRLAREERLQPEFRRPVHDKQQHIRADVDELAVGAADSSAGKPSLVDPNRPVPAGARDGEIEALV